MKIKKIVIQIKSLDEVLNNFVSVGKRIQTGKKVVPSKGTYVADVETARSIFTEGRLKVIQTLKDKKPGSIYALAKLLKRDFKNVYEDVRFLSELGIISIEENDTGRSQKKPVLVCDEILFKMAA